jgi:hypothetical protein
MNLPRTHDKAREQWPTIAIDALFLVGHVLYYAGISLIYVSLSLN